MSRSYILDCARTAIAIGKPTGTLSSSHPVDVLTHVLTAIQSRTPHSLPEDVICGVVTPIGQQGANVGRLAAIKAYGKDTPGVQLNRMCGSGLQAINMASQGIVAGDMDLVVGCGVELMSSTKMGSDTDLFGPDTPSSAAFKAGFPFKLLHQGVSAELLAAKYGVTRQECDDFAVRSHTLAHKAIQEGRFKSQIVPFQAKQADGTVKLLEQDEGVKFPVDHAKLTSLKAIFKPEGGGVVTAGNASQISDGAAAVLLASERYLKTSGLKPRAAILSRVAVGSDPEIMLDGVIPATHRALKKAGLSLKDMDVIEINEAFASVVLGWAKEVKADMTKVNPNGGAIALGHPLGATGAFLTCKALHELERTNGRYAVITACIGHGQAVATVIERV